jgi:serine/threonine-protein kinase
VLHAVHAEVQGAVTALKREASFLAMLRSPCFPRILRTGTTPTGLPYFAMEFASGRSLEQRLKETGRFPADAVAELLDDVCEGVAEMHARDLLHRDLKPGNIVVEQAPGGRTHSRLLDLGSAKATYEPDPPAAKGTLAFGSPPYLAPETAATGATSERSDLYSLGATAYELLCGIRAVHIQDTSPDSFVRYLKSAGPIPTYRIATVQPDIPERVEAVIQKALERDPSRRFGTVTEFRSALFEAVGRRTSTAPRLPAQAPAGPSPKPAERSSSSAVGRLRRLLPLHFRKG